MKKKPKKNPDGEWILWGRCTYIDKRPVVMFLTERSANDMNEPKQPVRRYRVVLLRDRR